MRSMRNRIYAGVLPSMIAALTLTAPLAAQAAPGARALPVSSRDVPPDGTYRILTFADKCFDVDRQSPNNDAVIHQWDCGPFSQRMRLQSLGDGSYHILTFADKCLDVDRQSPDNGAVIHQWDCGPFSQRLRLQSLGDGRFRIMTFADKCFDIDSGSPDNDRVIHQWDCGYFSQAFRFQPA